MDEFRRTSSQLEQILSRTANELTDREEELKEREKKFELQKKEMEKYPIKETVIELNVGGRHFTTYKDTLCAFEGSMIEAMFSGRHPTAKDAKGRYFVDRDGDMFAIVLNFLRTGFLFWPKDDNARSQLKLELEYYGLLDIVTAATAFPESKILAFELEEKLLGYLPDKKEWKLLYQGTRDGFQSNAFHSKCDGKGATITIIQTTTGCIFGGYATSSWNSSGQWIHDATAFLFCLKNPNGLSYKCPVNPNNRQHALHGNPNTGPMFGTGNDLLVSNNCNVSGSSLNVGNTYTANQHPYEFLGGQQNTFVVQEIEVFGVVSSTSNQAATDNNNNRKQPVQFGRATS
jgi:hypothetical protein